MFLDCGAVRARAAEVQRGSNPTPISVALQGTSNLRRDLLLHQNRSVLFTHLRSRFLKIILSIIFGMLFFFINSFQLVQCMDSVRSNSRGGFVGPVMSLLSLCVTLYYGLELLDQHGIRPFFNHFRGGPHD